MAEDAEAAMAAAELDGNRPRKINPLTIIQVTKSLIIFSGNKTVDNYSGNIIVDNLYR
jgi:hypothetical protein